jgi:hypothetical protein
VSGGRRYPESLKEESSFSEEKEAKRLLSIKVDRRPPPDTNSQKFFGSFFQGRTTLSYAFGPGNARDRPSHSDERDDVR